MKILHGQLQRGHACLCLKDQEGDGGRPETAAALIFLGADSLAGGFWELTQHAQTC